MGGLVLTARVVDAARQSRRAGSSIRYCARHRRSDVRAASAFAPPTLMMSTTFALRTCNERHLRFAWKALITSRLLSLVDRCRVRFRPTGSAFRCGRADGQGLDALAPFTWMGPACGAARRRVRLRDAARRSRRLSGIGVAHLSHHKGIDIRKDIELIASWFLSASGVRLSKGIGRCSQAVRRTTRATPQNKSPASLRARYKGHWLDLAAGGRICRPLDRKR